MRRLVTRIYFPDEPGNDARLRPGASCEPERRDTLIAKRTAEPGRLDWNIVLQGRGETVFFDC